MKNLIEKINSAKIIQTEYPDEMLFPKKIQEILYLCTIVADELYIDRHRWYELSTTVYEFEGQYFGIEYVTQCYSESSSIEDMYHTIKAFPMKAVQVTTYEKI